MAVDNYSAYCPNLPGYVVIGKMQEETERNMHEAVKIHIEGLPEDKLAIPQIVTQAEYIAVTV